ncbi:hypothetical protein CDL12_27005 [Handroanthus impetiginosus]|uniref:Uncharacterized protein n=1 Tax=Handroanthus impetiginosus TaxID=429701 RepID=A0A2G9G5T5_9LAMI|nr:hypothetical protein CDL12_27005 [Handroanthus impetiginosus]
MAHPALPKQGRAVSNNPRYERTIQSREEIQFKNEVNIKEKCQSPSLLSL